MRKPLILALLICGPAAFAETTLLSNIQPKLQGQGGMSALELTNNGTRFYALSDQGYLSIGSVTRLNGVISDLVVEDIVTLKAPNGSRDSRTRFDTEGLALDGKGGFYISLEGPARVWHYSSPTAAPTQIATPAAFESYGRNSSFEALAILENGHIVTLPERSGRHDTPFPAYEWNGNDWSVRFQLSRVVPFLPVAADLGPDGALYILERDFQGFLFRSQVRRITPDLTVETVLNTSHENLEGIDVWRDAEGALRMTMISDNNLKDWLPTRVVEYRLGD